jgi:hypothetical protein
VAANEHPRFWLSKVPVLDDFGELITNEFIDGRLGYGKGRSMRPWGFFTPASWETFGCGRLGSGYGQRYEKQADGRFLKVEG